MTTFAVAQSESLVSVVMAFHNAHNTLADALQSILWQTYSNWELVLLDDGSTDGSAEIVNQFSDPRIRLVSDSVCRSLPVRLNQGVRLAKGPYIARMDADDIAFPERFARQVEYLQNHPEVDLLATTALMIDGESQPVGVLGSKAAHEALCRRPWHGFSMPHPTWMGRLDWFLANPYDEVARKAQDQVLLYRSYSTSRFAAIPDVLLAYRYTSLSVSKTLSGRYYYLHEVAGGNKMHLLLGLTSHSAAAIRDLLGMALKVESRVIQAKVNSTNTGLLKYWQELRQRLTLLNEKG